MNICFKVFASYNILQYLCDFIHVLIFVTVSKCRNSPKLTNKVINIYHYKLLCGSTTPYIVFGIHDAVFFTTRFLFF